MKLSDEFKIGVLAVVALTILILGFNFIKGNDLFKSTKKLYSSYQKINGLSVSDPVFMYGYQVGKVESIEVIEYGVNPRILISFSIRDEANIAHNSVARIFSTDLLGTKALEVVPGESMSFVEDGDTIAGDIEVSLTESINEVLNPLQQKTVSLIGSLDSLLGIFQEVLDTNTKADIEGSFRSIAQTLKNVENTTSTFDRMATSESVKLSRILTTVEQISTKLNSNLDTFTIINNNLAQISDSLAATDFKGTVERAYAALEEVEDILIKVNNGEGSLGMLVNDPKLYQNLEAATRDLDNLVLDIKKNPHRYLNFSVLSFGGGGNNKDK
ncbi:MAG: MlaD family protein [Bacteroidia bacterium]